LDLCGIFYLLCSLANFFNLGELFRFETFGPLRYVRITKDAQTGRSRGTGFVCFKLLKDADECLKEAEISAKAALEISSQSKMNESAKKKKRKIASSVSSITPDLPITTSSKFILGGRLLSIARAVGRKEAEDLTMKGRRERRSKDSRNLYLMREGVILPDSKEADSLTSTEVSRRAVSFASRKKMLAQNPNLFISKTRLSLRNLWTRVDDTLLKQVSVASVKKFWEEVEASQRQSLDDEVIEEEIKSGMGKPCSSRKIKIKQVKMMIILFAYN